MRSTIKKDILGFGLPAILVFSAGLVVCAIDIHERLIVPVSSPGGALEYRSLFSAWSITGMVLYAAGLMVALTAVFTLKRFYSSTLVTRNGHQLITHGIYRLTRHPVYLGTLMCMIGISMFTRSLYGFLIMLVMIPIFLYRIRMEERMLTGKFGDGYRTYMKSTKKLVPFIHMVVVMLISLSSCGSPAVDLLI